VERFRFIRDQVPLQLRSLRFFGFIVVCRAKALRSENHADG
jgi:hypothetical protein